MSVSSNSSASSLVLTRMSIGIASFESAFLGSIGGFGTHIKSTLFLPVRDTGRESLRMMFNKMLPKTLKKYYKA